MKRQRGRRALSTVMHLERFHYFVPIAVKTFDVFGPEARSLLLDLGYHIISSTQDPLSYLHLKQQISVAVQRGNLVSVRGSSREVTSVEDSFLY